MLVVSSTGLFLAYPEMDGSVTCYKLDLTADVRARELADGYMLTIPSGRTVISFFLQSYVELERVVSGPPGTKQVLARISSACASGRVFAGFAIAAAGLALVVPYGSTILFSDYMTGYSYLQMKRPGVVGEAREKIPAGSSLFTSPAAGALREAVINFQDERFTASMNNADIALNSCGGVGDTGAYLRGTLEGAYKIFCTRADDYLKEHVVNSSSGSISESHYKRADFYADLVDELMPDFPPSEFYYDLIIRHLRLAMVECDGDIPLSYQWLLVRIIGMQRFSVNIPLKDIDPSLLQNWYLESRRIFSKIQSDLPVDDARLFEARLLFREEKWDEATALLKLLPGKKPWLMMASAARYTGSSLQYHLRRVREVASSTPSLEFEATLLESLLLAQLEQYKEAKELLGKYAGDHPRGFQARALRILVLNQGNLSTPTTEALEPKMRSSLAGPFQRVGDLPWSWWMTSVDLEYMAGIREGSDEVILKRLSGLSWYPYKKRAADHMGKAKKNTGIENGDLTSFLYQGYLEGVVDGLK
jgi:hypothetical protein